MAEYYMWRDIITDNFTFDILKCLLNCTPVLMENTFNQMHLSGKRELCTTKFLWLDGYRLFQYCCDIRHKGRVSDIFNFLMELRGILALHCLRWTSLGFIVDLKLPFIQLTYTTFPIHTRKPMKALCNASNFTAHTITFTVFILCFHNSSQFQCLFFASNSIIKLDTKRTRNLKEKVNSIWKYIFLLYFAVELWKINNMRGKLVFKSLACCSHYFPKKIEWESNIIVLSDFRTLNKETITWNNITVNCN